MAKAFALKLDSGLNEACYRYLIDKTTEGKKAEVGRFLKKEDAYRSLFAEFLVRYIVQASGIEKDDISFGYSDYGKPFLPGIDSIHFNVSHSGQWVVCAIDEYPVGIDIEFIAPIDLDISEKHFSAAEHNDLLAKKGADQLHYFYDLWTLKESYIKQQGKGLSISLKSFTIRLFPENGITIHFDRGTHKNVFFKQYDIDEQYALALCATTNSFEDIKIITLQEIVDFF